MIHDQILPMFLWAEDSRTNVYVHNRCPHKIVKNMTPKEAFTGVKLEMGHLRIFGYPIYIHVPKKNLQAKREFSWDTMNLQRPT